MTEDPRAAPGHAAAPAGPKRCEDDAEARTDGGLVDEFLSTVSHELRTPLTAIKGCARTLLRHGRALDPAVAEQLLRDIDHEAERLHRLVENLLELSRAGSGTAARHIEPTAVDVLIRRVVADVTPRAGERRFRLRLPADLPRPSIDAVRIEQVVRNLIDNALKYSPPGGTIEVSAARDGGVLVVTVADEGPGVAPEHRERVFDRFFRVEPPGMSVGGAGLGLAICRRFVEMHGGRMDIDPARGNGAAFRFTLPLPEGDAAPMDEPDRREAAAGRRAGEGGAAR
jgi:signal transduction histidine kinase